MLKFFIQRFSTVQIPAAGKWLAMSACVGFAVGVAAVVFEYLLFTVQFFFLNRLAGYAPGGAVAEYSPFPDSTHSLNSWYLLLVLGLGGFCAGWLAWRFSPEAAGAGTDAAVDAFHNKRGSISLRTSVVKIVSSAITLGTGGSAGKEGPIAQIGAGIGSTIGTALNLSDRDRRILLAAGMGAGVGALFRAPLAGALFAGEILYRETELEADVIMPAAVASTISYSVFCFSLPPEFRFLPLFGGDLNFEFGTPLELFPYALLACVMAGAGIVYTQTFHASRKWIQQLNLPAYLTAACGAVAAGGLALVVHRLAASEPRTLSVLGSGYSVLQACFTEIESVAIPTLLIVALVKMLTTTLSVSSGGSGGVFGPSMVIGGCLGGATGKLFNLVLPNIVNQPGTFAVVGMAGFFAGCARAPFSTILMVTELTGSYRLLLPAMWVSTLCFLFMRRWTLYENQVPTRLESPAHRGDFIIDVLEGMTVAEASREGPPPRLIDQAESLNTIVHLLSETSQSYFPVVNEKLEMVGIFSTEDIRSYLYDDVIWEIANAADVMKADVVTVTPEDDLNTAMTKFTELNVDELPIVEAQDPRKIIGMLKHKQAIDAYNKRRLHSQTE